MDQQSDSAKHKSKQVVGSLKLIKPSVFGEVKRLASKDESSESDEEGSEFDEDEETTPVENKNWTPEESFAELPLYCHNLKVKNSGTITHIETHDQDRFEIFFLAVGDAIPPLAYGVGKSETFTSWDWFLRKLKECIIDFEERFSTLRNWLPSVANKLDMIGFEKWARVHFPAVTSVWRASYKEIIYDVGHPLEWEQSDGLITVLPPLMDKRPPGRLRNSDRFRSKGEQIKQKSCTWCFRGGHNHHDCPTMVPSQIFILTTSSVKSSSSTSIVLLKMPLRWQRSSGLCVRDSLHNWCKRVKERSKTLHSVATRSTCSLGSTIDEGNKEITLASGALSQSSSTGTLNHTDNDNQNSGPLPQQELSFRMSEYLSDTMRHVPINHDIEEDEESKVQTLEDLFQKT
nr:MLO-like protein 4 [Tanacetum cinerariifolium]